MNSFEIKYTGNLRTSATHLESNTIIDTDAPKDNHGLGEAFSPTDLMCVSLASCMLTIMGISMKKQKLEKSYKKLPYTQHSLHYCLSP